MNNNKYPISIQNVLKYLESTYGKFKNLNISPRTKIQYLLTQNIIRLSSNIMSDMNYILQSENNIGVIDLTTPKSKITLIKCDITKIKCDAIVNAANSVGLGCFQPGHKCIDNIIHDRAGPALKIKCQEILNGSQIPTSKCIITPGYNLPAKYVIHVVGPIYHKDRHEQNIQELANSYTNVIKLAERNNLETVAFCCISTGEFGFDQKLAANVVCRTILTLETNINICLCTYTDADHDLYKKLIY